MNPSTMVVALVHTAKKTGQVLLIISVLSLLLLIAAGAGLFHPASWQAGAQLAATTGDIHVGGAQLAATTGDVHIGSTMQARSSQAGVQLAASVGDIHIGS